MISSNILYDLYTHKDIGNPTGIPVDSNKNTQREEARADINIPSSYAIPTQLRRQELRFIKVAKRDKIPVEKDWLNSKNYAWKDPELIKWIVEGGNYGILPRGGIGIIDLDDIGAALNLGIIDHFDTFTVRSGSGNGIHLYVKCEGIADKIPFYEKDADTHIGEFYGSGANAYVVGPGSVHPYGNRYEVTKNKDLITVTPEQLDEYLFKKVKSSRFNSLKRNIPSEIKDQHLSLVNELNLRIEDILPPVKPTAYGDELQGSHPIHGSTTGKNYSMNRAKNVAYCFRHNCGGSPFYWIAVREGYIQCGEPLTKETYNLVLQWLRSNGYAEKLNPDVLLDGPPLQNNPQYTPLELHLEDDNFVSRYMKYASKKTDAYREYHIAGGLSLLSIAAQRNAVIHLNVADIYCNIWCFLLGASSVSRKSTSISLAKNILRGMDIEQQEIPRSFSPESFIEILSESPRSYYINSEGAGLLQSSRKKYMGEIIDILCDLYDNVGISRQLTMKRSQQSRFIVNDPYVTMLMASTPDRFEESSSSEYFQSGFYYRFLWFYPDYPHKTKPVKQVASGHIMEEKILQKSYDELSIFFKAHVGNPVSFLITSEMMGEYNEWSSRLNEQYHRAHDFSKLTALSRLEIMALKIAMLFTIGRNNATAEMDEGVITIWDTHLREAMRLVESYFLPIVGIVQQNVDQSSNRSDAKQILIALRNFGGSATRSKLLRKTRMKSKDFDEALSQLMNETMEVTMSMQKERKNQVSIYHLATT